MKQIKIEIDHIQQCLSYKITLFPGLYRQYLEQLELLSQQHRVCLLPSAVFELYDIRIREKLYSTITTFPPYAQQYALARLYKHRCMGYRIQY